MIIGTTPMFTLKLKRTYDISLTEVHNIYVTLKQGNILITKTGADLDIIDEKTIQFSLTQEESLSFVIDKVVELQVNWTYISNGDTKRAASKVITINLEKQLLKQEIH